MSTSNQTFFRATPLRSKPPPNADSQTSDVTARSDRYGGHFESSAMRKAHVLADEGAYFITTSGPGGSINTGTNNAFVATAPYIIVQNTDNSGADVRIYLDYIQLATVSIINAASAVNSYTALAIITDAALRYVSGGSNLVVSSPNQDISPSSVAAAFAGGSITASAPTTRARTIVGNRNLRFAMNNATAIIDNVGDTKLVTFGSVEAPASMAGSGAGVQVAPGIFGISVPPVVIGPQQSALIYLWYVGATTIGVGAYGVEIGWWER